MKTKFSFIFIGFIAFYALVRLLLAWPIMLLVDPATAGNYTISYGQAIAASILVGLLLPSNYNSSGKS